MKRSIMTVIALCIVACGDDAEAKEPAISEIESTPNIVIVENTPTISYHLYRQAWKKANNKPVSKWEPITTTTPVTDEDTNHKTVELFLSELSFKDAFRLQFLGKGEGHTFWWRGAEYTTNLLDVVRQPVIHQEDDVRDGGGDQGTIGE
tara:strand:- start:1 stop:447 length:447 start_codon:yes stop_codon:yes gene_type:complete